MVIVGYVGECVYSSEINAQLFKDDGGISQVSNLLPNDSGRKVFVKHLKRLKFMVFYKLKNIYLIKIML